MRGSAGSIRSKVTIAAATGILAAFVVRRRRVSGQIDDLRSRLRTDRVPVVAEPYNPDSVGDLPPPVREYFNTVLDPGQYHIDGATLRQEGEFRLAADWYPFSATQTYTVAPPGYLWDATIRMAPGVSARVLDAYVRGEGLLRANLLGVLPVASAGPDPQMNEAELQRYLSETPWFPTALLPGAGVTWEEVDDRSARATITDGDSTATAVFHFDDSGHIVQLTADRYRQDTDTVAPWVGEYWAYERRNGVEIPTEAEVAWETDDGEVPYWRGSVSAVQYRGR